MKSKFLYMLLGAALFVGLASAFAFDKSPDTATKSGPGPTGIEAVSIAEEAADMAPAAGDYAIFEYRKDTITNAAKDTLFVGRRTNTAWNTVSTPTNFLSLFTYDISIVRASLSGTHNVKVYLDKSDITSGTSTDWQVIDSTSATTATNATIRGTDATGARYRLRISGTGSQSSTYQIWSIWKKKN
jgi:hypothetical protein